MTINRYRALLISSLVLGILGGALDLIFPALLSDEFHRVQNTQDSSISAPHLLLVLSLGILGGGCALVSIYGLYRFRPWAPRLAVAGTVLALMCWPFLGAFVQSGFAISISSLGSYLWGAVVALAYVQPISAHFKRNAG